MQGTDGADGDDTGLHVSFSLCSEKESQRVSRFKNPLAEKDAIDKPARAAITLSVENKSHLLPVTKGIAKVRYENPFSGDKGKMKIRFSVDTGKKRDRRIPVVMDNCGNVSITVEKVRIYDYLNIFAWTIGKHFETQDVLVLPPTKGDVSWKRQMVQRDECGQ